MLGFLVGAAAGPAAEHFRSTGFPLPLSVHPATRFAIARQGEEALALIGEAVHPDRSDLDLQGVADHLAKHRATRQPEIDKLVGRFVVIHGRGSDFRIQTDAIGLRSVFYAATDRGVVAGSHAELVARAATGTAVRRRRPLRWGHPGIDTPFESVFRLPPNCELAIADGKLHRFFPAARVPETGIEDAWALAFDRAATTIRALAARHNLVLSLTAGLDSRTTLAASRGLWRKLKFFTYVGRPEDHLEARVASDVAKRLRLDHFLVDYSDRFVVNGTVRAAISCNAIIQHKPKVACAYHHQLGQHRYLHIRSNLLELTRSNLFEHLHKRHGLEGPASAETMTAVYKHAARIDPTRLKHVRPAFDHYVAVSDFESTIGRASPWDLYFVEHRMGAWQSGVVTESDVSFDTVIAFNSREIVRAFMGVPDEVRCTSGHLRELLNGLLPELSDIPINPRRYPPRAPARK
ncbi:MAG TPA: hypothetical protein VF210_01235 [Pseudomonadales bacterium]